MAIKDGQIGINDPSFESSCLNSAAVGGLLVDEARPRESVQPLPHPVVQALPSSAGEETAPFGHRLNTSNALRQGISRIANSANRRDIMSAFLTQAIEASGATAGAIYSRLGATKFGLSAVYADGAVLPEESWRQKPLVALLEAVSSSDETGHFARVAAGDQSCHLVEEAYADWFPEKADFHRRRGHKVLWDFPLKVRDEVTGLLTLAFKEDVRPEPAVYDVVCTLSQVTALALHMDDLSAREREAAVARERSRLAREIHDAVVQSFIGIKLQARKLDDTDSVVKRLRQMAEHGLLEARRALRALGPSLLKGGDLPAALRDLVETNAADSGLDITFEQVGPWQAFPHETSSNLFRIAQEALQNAIRHARASKISIELSVGDKELCILIEDDGVGFNPREVDEKGFGLHSMLQRAKLVGGELQIVSGHDGGTRVLISVAIPPPHVKKGV